MKFMITGGCGFLGSNLSKEVLRRGDELFIMDNLSRTGASQNLGWLRSIGQFHFAHGDTRCEADVEKFVRDIRPDVIFHLAGQVAMTTSISDPRRDFETNVVGGHNLLEAVRKFSPETIVFYSSTNKVYGDFANIKFIEEATRYTTPDYPQGFDESLALSFQSPYGCSKGAVDQYMLDYHRMFHIRTVVFRHSTIFGDRQFASYDQGWIGWFIGQALIEKKGLLKEPFTISGNGKQVRDLLFAPDLIQCYFNALEKIEHSQGQAYNIGGGFENSLSLLELFEFLETELDVRLKYRCLPWRASDQKVFIANSNRAKTKFGWSPKLDKFAALKDMIKWVSEC